MCRAESVSVNVPFDVSKYSTATSVIDGKAFTTVSYSDLSYGSDQMGSPQLPTKTIRLSVPYNAANFKVTYRVEGITERIVSAPVLPVQKPVTTNATTEDVAFTAPDSSIYQSSDEWPAKRCKYVENGYLYGSNQIVAISIYPITYCGATGKLFISNSISVTLSYDIVAESALGIKPIFSTDKTADVAKVVENGSQVAMFAPKNETRAYADNGNAKRLDYCVITNRELAPSFNRLIGWKRQKGYVAEVFCIEDILADKSVANGDEISGINDNAGKLRWFLRNLYVQRNLEYALLAGDSKILPIRYGYGSESSPAPTDLYFSDFSGNWDSNKNGKYGENGDKLDFYPEIIVGRLLCETPKEVDNYTDKLLCYEINPGNGDFSYLKRALYSHSANLLTDSEVDTLALKMSHIYDQYSMFKDISAENPTGAQIIAEMNRKYVGFFCINGHGNPGGVAVNYKITPPYGIIAIEGNNSYHAEEIGNGLNNLTNIGYPSISYSMSCTLMPYDIVSGHENVKCNFGRSYTTHGLYGGVAFLGNTRFSWLDEAVELEKLFVDEIHNGNYYLGKVEVLTKIKCGYLWARIIHNLLGDPEFEMWTDIPQYYNGVNISRGNQDISLSGAELTGSYVGITDFSGNAAKYKIDGNNWSINCFSPNSSILLYRHNNIPEFMPLNIQNESITGSHYMLASSLSIGKNIDQNRSSGNVSFCNGAHVTFKVTGNVELADGFEVKSGASVTIISDGVVSINGGNIENEGKLHIVAKSTDIKHSFATARGAELNITNK